MVVPDGGGASLDRPYRPIRITFRLLASGALGADTGDGIRTVSLPTSADDGLYSGEVSLRASGWRRGSQRPPWLVAQDEPTPCTILSVTSEIMGNT